MVGCLINPVCLSRPIHQQRHHAKEEARWEQPHPTPMKHQMRHSASNYTKAQLINDSSNDACSERLKKGKLADVGRLLRQELGHR